VFSLDICVILVYFCLFSFIFTFYALISVLLCLAALVRNKLRSKCCVASRCVGAVRGCIKLLTFIGVVIEVRCCLP